MVNDKIIVKGARQNNLKNIDVELPRNEFVVITGLSGSGKSSLAFDTIYAEGQRRYVESLSSYARQFLGQMDKPDVDDIIGLSPAVSIDQKSTSKNPRSTVGTVTEIYDYMRLLWARIGKPHCPKCGIPISAQSVDQMIDSIMTYPVGTKIQILSPVIRGKKGQYNKMLEDLKKEGFLRVRVNGEQFDLSERTELIDGDDKNKKHSIDIIIDRIVVKEGIEKRLSDSLEIALKKGGGLIALDIIDGEEILMSENYSCNKCEYALPEISPRMFSFNSPYGACPECHGLGYHSQIDPNLLIPNKKLSIEGGAIANFAGLGGEWLKAQITAVAEKMNFDLRTPIKDYTKEQYNALLNGVQGNLKVRYFSKSRNQIYQYNVHWKGLVGILNDRYNQTSSDGSKEDIEQYMSQEPCKVCVGKRLKPESLAVLINNFDISSITEYSIEKAFDWFSNVNLSERDAIIAKQINKEIKARLKFLIDVGLNYLTLSRATGSLSGGEAQRIRLATQIGSGLMGVLYVLDEPSIGLHQRDNSKLISTLKYLRDIGNTIIVVEHDEETMLESDYIVDIGPFAGEHGGKVIFAGTPKEILDSKNSLTGKYLSGEMKIPVPKRRRNGNGESIVIKGARENNLKSIDVSFPLGKLICVTGVSGSGKSSLIQETLYPKIQIDVGGLARACGKHDSIFGLENIDKVINIDQSPIGRTPRSNPATYTGVFDLIRELFSNTQEAKVRGYKPGRFSFNVKGGRCESCSGDGIIKIEMHFLPDVYVPCEVCNGQRYNRETLKIKYKGKSIADVLNMTVEQAVKFFEHIPKIQRKLQTIHDVGLDYVKLGQPATTLSGGEAQRMKLAAELSKKSTGKTMYILDEPTTGLHFHDVSKLIEVLNKFVDNGNTVLVIEHNLDVIKSADHIIDMGPEGGDSGGQIIAFGTPEEISKIAYSHTGAYLAKVLNV